VNVPESNPMQFASANCGSMIAAFKSRLTTEAFCSSVNI